MNMSIATEILRLQKAKEDIKQSIINKGVSVEDTDTLDTYSLKIDEISGGGGDADQIIIDLIEKDITQLNIPQGTTKIADYSLYGCSSLTSVTIPNSVTEIGAFGFSYCSGLTNVTIPNSVDTISNNAFQNCSSLSSATIGNSVNNIGSAAFDKAPKLATLYCNWLIPPTNGQLGFSYTGGTLHIPNGASQYYRQKWSGTTAPLGTRLNWNLVEDQGDYTPTNVLVAKYNVSSTTTPTTLFYSTAFASDSTVWIEDTPQVLTNNTYTFTNEGINEIRVDSCKMIWGDFTHPFQNCKNLISVTIPNNVTSISIYAFYNCSGLISVTIPDSVTSIGGYAFSNCSGLTSVIIPNSVTSIGNRGFSGSSSLTNIEIPNSVTSIGSAAFYACTSLTSVTIGNSVTSIGNSAFSNCSGLTSVTIPNSVTSIGDETFRSSGLKSVTIPNSITSIAYGAFSYCYSLTDINYNGTIEQWNTISKESGWKDKVPATCKVHCTDGDINI